MGTTRRRDELSAVNVKRMIRFLWVLALLPLVVVLAAGWQTSRAESWVSSRGTVTVPGGVFVLQTGHDRRGDHVAALGRDRNAYVLRLEHGRALAQKLQYPWPDTDGYRIRVAFADATSDDLVDLHLMRFVVDENSASEGRAPDYPQEEAIFRQEADGFVLDRIAEFAPITTLDDEQRTMSAYGDQLALATISNGTHPRTQVFSASSKRVIDLLEGEPYEVRDVDGDGNQDLLTAEERFDLSEAGYNTFRLYLFRQDRIHHVWTGTFRNLDLWRSTRRFTAVGDLDSDGLCEIIVAEPHRGMVEVFGLDRARLAG